ncbi:ATP-binding protein [Streptomyces filipinensis]|uniref:ATP-binding protein n=2 Tax=Streptomyces filipinensis TaxID=66887 RepID=A0A918I6X8_9ACTN|nr:ATP-binding protein [Streptomyces filipinensis]
MTAATDQDHMEHTDRMAPTEPSGSENAEVRRPMERGDLRGELPTPSPGVPGEAGAAPQDGTPGDRTGEADRDFAPAVPSADADEYKAAAGDDMGEPAAEIGDGDPGRRWYARATGEETGFEPPSRGVPTKPADERDARVSGGPVRGGAGPATGQGPGESVRTGEGGAGPASEHGPDGSVRGGSVRGADGPLPGHGSERGPGGPGGSVRAGEGADGRVPGHGSGGSVRDAEGVDGRVPGHGPGRPARGGEGPDAGAKDEAPDRSRPVFGMSADAGAKDQGSDRGRPVFGKAADTGVKDPASDRSRPVFGRSADAGVKEQGSGRSRPVFGTSADAGRADQAAGQDRPGLRKSADAGAEDEAPDRNRSVLGKGADAGAKDQTPDRRRPVFGRSADAGAEDQAPDRGRPVSGKSADAAGGQRLRPPHRTPRQSGPSDEAAPRRRPDTGPAADPGPGTHADPGAHPDLGPGIDPDAESTETWDDGLIARRVTDAAAAALAAERESATRALGGNPPVPLAYDGPLRSRLDALRELVGLSRARLDKRTLAEAGRVLDEAAARRKLSGRHTVIAIAGATGSGKSQLFNALAGVAISETGVRRPTTAAPIACSWSDGAAGLIDRLGIPGRLRRRPVHNPETEAELRGLVLVDLPDHDSAALQHREQVDRILKLVDAVIWVVDPEKYADAVLHERYLRPLAGHAEVMFVVLNQVDRLPGEAADQVLDDLRRLLDEDGVALGEHGEPGATVLALSALTGEGVGELREALGQFVAERGAAARRVAADVDAAAVELRPVYAAERRVGLSEEAREEFAARLADAVGATAAGDAAERAWLRNANRACGTPWLRLWRWYQGRGDSTTGRHAVRAQADEEATARQRVEQAVRTVSDRASAGLPGPWAQAVREAAVRGSQGLSEALDELAARAGLPPGRPPRPGWWPAAVLVQAAMTLLQIVGGLWLAGQIAGVMAPNLGIPVLLMVCGIIGGPLVEWGCRMAARGPARRYGQEAERRLREAAAGCGRARVLDPVAAELLRYREVREQYGRVARSGPGVRVG